MGAGLRRRGQVSKEEKQVDNAECRPDKPLGFGLHFRFGWKAVGISVPWRHIGADSQFTRLTRAAVAEKRLTGLGQIGSRRKQQAEGHRRTRTQFGWW